MEDVKSILVASERLFGCASDPSETMRQTRIVTEVCFLTLLFVVIPLLSCAHCYKHWGFDAVGWWQEARRACSNSSSDNS